MSVSTFILLIDDDILIRELVEAGLTDAGFEVHAFSTGADAIASIESEAPRALETDVNLGRPPNGWEIARRARELIPDMPVIYMTGDSGHEWPAQGVPNSSLLIKPFAPAQVVTALSTLLNDLDIHRASST